MRTTTFRLPPAPTLPCQKCAELEVKIKELEKQLKATQRLINHRSQ